jgi:membrane associated rhomboid family serine protease
MRTHGNRSAPTYRLFAPKVEVNLEREETMIAGRNSEDYYPITWVGRCPIYLTTVLVALHVVTMAAVAVAAGLEKEGWIEVFKFSSARVLTTFSVWEFVTYAFVNEPSLWFAVEMYFLLSFGREVEKFLGRKAFFWLYMALLLVTPMVLTGAALFGYSTTYFGSGPLHFAVFVAFVTIYPTAEIFFGLQARWLALILLSIYSLQYVAQRQWMYLGVLWLECGCAYAILRAGGVRSFGRSGGFLDELVTEYEKPWRGRARKEKPEPVKEDPFESIDPLLEKISKQGIGSLTKRERERLEKAREALIDRERQR